MKKRDFLFLALAGFAILVARPVSAREDAHLYLDSGFMGRPVTFNQFGGTVRLGLEKDSLLGPNELDITLDNYATGTFEDYELQPEVVSLKWQETINLSFNGITVGLPQACTPSAWTNCKLFVEKNGEWKPLDSERVYGDVKLRMGKSQAGYMQQGFASWYKYKDCKCAASPDFPKGSLVNVESLASGKCVTVRINDFGPERDIFPDRVIDLDASAFKDLAPLGAGVIKVKVSPVVIKMD